MIIKQPALGEIVHSHSNKCTIGLWPNTQKTLSPLIGIENYQDRDEIHLCAPFLSSTNIPTSRNVNLLQTPFLEVEKYYPHFKEISFIQVETLIIGSIEQSKLKFKPLSTKLLSLPLHLWAFEIEMSVLFENEELLLSILSEIANSEAEATIKSKVFNKILTEQDIGSKTDRFYETVFLIAQELMEQDWKKIHNLFKKIAP